MSDAGHDAERDDARDARADDPWRTARENMVRGQIAARGVRDPRVLEALRAVPRHRYVPAEFVAEAYADTPLPLAAGQTISQPYMVAGMVEALGLRGDERVLEVGTGSGYAAAVLGELAREVHTLERHAELADAARARLAEEGRRNVHVHHADGTRGWLPAAPYDAIVVAAGAARVPPALRAQLAPGGRLVIPVGPDAEHQRLQRLIRDDARGDVVDDLGPVRFVPLVRDRDEGAPGAADGAAG